jgi:hypothetical protein
MLNVVGWCQNKENVNLEVQIHRISNLECTKSEQNMSQTSKVVIR